MDIEQREQAAKRILNDPIFQEAWTSVHDEFMDLWENSKSHDTEARENLWLGLQLLKRLKVHFESAMTTGELSRRKNPFY